MCICACVCAHRNAAVLVLVCAHRCSTTALWLYVFIRVHKCSITQGKCMSTCTSTPVKVLGVCAHAQAHLCKVQCAHWYSITARCWCVLHPCACITARGLSVCVHEHVAPRCWGVFAHSQHHCTLCVCPRRCSVTVPWCWLCPVCVQCQCKGGCVSLCLCQCPSVSLSVCVCVFIVCACVYVCLCVSVSVCMYVFMCVFAHLGTSLQGVCVCTAPVSLPGCHKGVCVSVCMSVCLCMCLCVRLFVCLCMCLCVCLHLSVCPSVCLSMCPYRYGCLCLSVSVSVSGCAHTPPWCPCPLPVSLHWLLSQFTQSLGSQCCVPAPSSPTCSSRDTAVDSSAGSPSGIPQGARHPRAPPSPCPPGLGDTSDILTQLHTGAEQSQGAAGTWGAQ